MGIFLWVFIICIAAILGCAGIIKAIVLSHPMRYMHVPYLFLIGAYIVFIGFAYPLVLNYIDKLISIVFISQAVLTGVPSECYSAAFMLLIALFSNLLVLLLSLPVIVLAYNISKRSFEYRFFFLSVKAETFADCFYNIAGSKDGVYLRKKYLATVKWFKAMHLTVLILFVAGAIFAFVMLYVDVLISDKTLLSVMKYSYFIPMLTYLFLAEVYYFLDGEVEGVEATEFESDVVEQQRTGNYDALLELYRSRFPNAILNADACIIESSGMDEYIFNEVGNDFIERAKNPDAFTSVMESIKQSSRKLSDNYIEAVLAMMNSESVLINDTFFGEISIYLAGYLNYRLSTGDKVIVITMEEERTDQVIDTLRKSFKRINDVHAIWKVGTVEENHREDVDVLVCSALNPVRIDNEIFMKQVRCIIVDDPNGTTSSSAASDHFADMKFVEKLRDKSMQYIFTCSENSRNLEESIEHIINQPVTTFRNSIIRNGASVLVWKAESANKIQYQLKEEGPYMGTAYPIMLIAATTGVGKIGFRVSKWLPFITYRDVVQASINEIRQNLFKDGAINLASIVEINNIRHFTEDATLRFLVIADENCNLLSVAGNWCKYNGTDSSMIHIVSRPYMLRNFMAENLPILVRTTSVIRQIVPNKGEDTQRYVEAILISLYEEKNGRPDYELLELYNSHYGASFAKDQIEECLGEMVKRVFPDEPIEIYKLFSFMPEEMFTSDGESRDYTSYYRVRMSSASFYERLVSLRKYLYYRYGGSNKRYRTDVLVDDVCNYYVPKQIHCFNGELAIVKKIGGNELILERISPKDYPQYEQIGAYYAQVIPDSIQQIFRVEGKYSLSDLTVELRGEISGFYELTDGYKFKDPSGYSRILFDGNHEKYGLSQRTCKGLRLQIDLPVEEQDAVKFEVLFALMFNEIAKTLLPNNYRDIAAFVPETDALKEIAGAAPEGQENIVEFTPKVQIEGDKDADQSKPVIYLFEKSCVDQGLISEYRDKETLQNIFDIMFQYLSWETGEGVSGERFLKYGFDDYPEIINVEAMLAFLEQVRTKATPVAEETQVTGTDIYMSNLFEHVPRCEYCGRLAIEHIETSDHRIICNRCASQIVERQQELNNLYKTARKRIQEAYGVTIPTLRHLKFKSRDEILKAAGASGSDIVIGFYNRAKKELWVERHAPKIFLLNVLMHEMTHAWQDENIKGFMTKEISEGHANFVALELLREMKEELYADYWVKMMRDSLEDRAYYNGYILFERICKRSGPRRNPFDVAKELTERPASDEN